MIKDSKGGGTWSRLETRPPPEGVFHFRSDVLKNRSKGMEKFDLRVESNNRRKEGREEGWEKDFLFPFIWRVLFRDFSLWFFFFISFCTFEYLVSNVSSLGWIYISGISGDWRKGIERVEQCAGGIQLWWKIRTDKEFIFRGVRRGVIFNFFRRKFFLWQIMVILDRYWRYWISIPF